MMATSITRSEKHRGRMRGSVAIWALLSTWKTPTVSARQSMS